MDPVGRDAPSFTLESQMIYHISAGEDDQQDRLDCLLEAPPQDLLSLWVNFNLLVPKKRSHIWLRELLKSYKSRESSAHPYLLTRVFMLWLIHENGFMVPKVNELRAE